MCHGNTATAMFFGEVIYVVVRDADNRPILLFRYEDVLSYGLIQIKSVVVIKITVLPFILHVHGTFMLLRLS